jgi:predicted Zn finger-like uncharacterized protein
MLLATQCPECEAKLQLDQSAVGRRVRCSKCRHVFVVASVTFDKSAAEKATMTVSPETAAAPTAAVPTAQDAGRTHRARDELASSESQVKKFGHFNLQTVLGQGAYGRVFKAFDLVLDRDVALKIPKFSSDQQRLVERFLREAKAAARLRHPNIVAVFESGQVQNDYYIAAEFIDGETLSTRIEREPIEPTQAAAWCRDLAGALFYAHQNGVVHRDIKPGNILIDRSGRPQVTDFGLAKRVGDDATMTTEGALLGTPAYMSPEQARGQTAKVGPASDQYSLGAVLYELLTGKRPYDGPPHIAIAKAAGKDPPPQPRSIRPGIPRDLEAICLHCLEKDPARRYRDAGALAEDLGRWLEGRPVRVRRIGDLERFARWCRRNPVLSTSLATTLVFVLLVIGGAFTRVIRIVQDRDQELASANDELKSVRRELAASRSDQHQLAVDEFERGRNLCEHGELALGLLRLARQLTAVTPELADLDAPIRSYIGSWLPHIQSLRLVIPHESRVNSVAISPDGKFLLSGTGGDAGPSGAQLWELQTGAAIGPRIQHQAAVAQVAYSPTGRLVATASLDRTACLIDPATGRIVHTLSHPDGVWCVAFSPDGKRLATGCSDENARVWDVETGQLASPLLDHPRPYPNWIYDSANPRMHIKRALFDPTGKSLLTSTPDSRLQIWDLGTSRVAARSPTGANVWPIAFADGGKQVLAQFHENGWTGAQFRNAATFRPAGPSFPHRERLSGVCVSADGRRVLTTGETSAARLWDRKTAEPLGQALLHPEGLCGVISPDQKTVVTGGRDQTVRIWSVFSTPLGGRALDHNSSPFIRFRPDGHSLLTSDKSGDGMRIRILDAATGKIIAGPYELREMDAGGTKSIAFTSDGSIFARGNWNSVRLYRSDTGAQVSERLAHPGDVRAMTFTQGDTFLITACDDGGVRFWNRKTAEFEGSVLKHKRRVNSMSLSPDGTLLLTACEDGTARLWDWKARSPVGAEMKQSTATNWAAFHPDGKTVATAGDDGAVRFWSVPEGNPISPPITDRGDVETVQFTPDGTRLVTSTEEGSTRVWDFATRLPATRPFLRESFLGGGAEINRDGTLIATVGSDSAVRLWDVPKPTMGPPQNIIMQLETTLGATLASDRQIRALNSTEWQERARQLGTPSAPVNAASVPPVEVAVPTAAPPPAVDNELSPKDKAAGLELLFNGRDHAGWRCDNGRPIASQIENGSLVPYRSGGRLIVYEQQWGDFILSCDVKMSPNGHSAIFFRVGNLKDPDHTGFKVPLEPRVGTGREDLGAIYDLAGPRKAPHLSPEWNAVTVSCKGPLIAISVNDQVTAEINCEEWTKPGRSPDGSPNRFARAIKDFPRVGYIGLQDSDSKVWFKNIKLLRR